MNRSKNLFGIGCLTLLGTFSLGNSAAVADDHGRDLIGGQETKLEEVTEDPQRFQGRSIRLQGEIDEIHSGQLLSLEEIENNFLDDVFDEDEVLIVVGSTAGMTEESRLSIIGRVYPYSLSELERRFPQLLLTDDTRDELESTYSGKAMMVADRVSTLR